MGYKDGRLLKFAVPEDTKFNPEVSLMPLLGTVLYTAGSVAFQIEPILNLVSRMLVSLSSEGVSGLYVGQPQLSRT